MQIFHSKTLEIFKTFSRSEILEFKIYLKNSAFNESNILCEFYNELIKKYPDNISGEILYSIQKKPKFRSFTMTYIRELSYRLIRKAQDFLIYNSFKKNSYLKEELLLNDLQSRKLDDLFIKRFINLMKLINDSPKNINEYHKEYIFNSMLFNYNERNSKLKTHNEGKRKLEEIIRCTNSLTRYYFFEITSNYVALIIDSDGFGIDHNDYKIIEADVIEKLFIQLQPLEDKVVQLYYLLFKAYENLKDDALYEMYRDFTYEIIPELHLDLQQFHFEYLYKYCTIKWSTLDSKINYRIELSKLYEFYMNNKMYITKENKYVRTTMLINKIKLSAELKDFRIVKNFIQENPSDINPVDKNIINSYAHAYENFVYKNFDKALAEINDIPRSNYSYRYEIKMLTIRLLYELNNRELSLVNINSYKKFLREDKFLNKEIKIITKNFLHYLETLILYAHKNEHLNFIHSQLKNENKVCHKEWLQEKYEAYLLKK
jgi:hypothetical protein